jgi:hypothetical protein
MKKTRNEEYAENIKKKGKNVIFGRISSCHDESHRGTMISDFSQISADLLPSWPNVIHRGTI